MYLSLANDSAWGRIAARVIARWPQHAEFVAKSLASLSPDAKSTGHGTAGLIERLAGDDLDAMIDGYRWMCEMVLEEEIHFRRNGQYRFTSFDDANREVYSNAPLMQRYMAGLLLSQILWSNHLGTFDFFVRKYVAGLGATTRHLEVGPGHGLLLYKAAERNVAELAGWDVSHTSLRHTGTSLGTLGVARPILLEKRNVFAPLRASDRGRFDSIVISEVLEHLERPRDALATLQQCLAPGGRIFVNAPVNAPALDHIYLFRQPEELISLVRDAGLIVDEIFLGPATGYTEERARRLGVVISVALIAHV